MKITLIIGTPDSGKSSLAEKLVCESSNKQNRYYVATMIPYGEEGLKRVEKHKKLREGKAFKTIEKPLDVEQVVPLLENPEVSTVLLECISNLVANEMFERHTPSDEIPEKIVTQIKLLAESVCGLYVVTNEFDAYSTEDIETKEYINCIALVNNQLKKISDEIYEVRNECI